MWFTVRSYRLAVACSQCARIELPTLAYSALVSICRRLFTVRWYRDVSACLQCALIEMPMLVYSALVSTCQRLFTGRSYRHAVACLQVARIEMPTLTLARYILETSLLDYWMSQQLDSKLAAASLLLALTMKRESDWVSRHSCCAKMQYTHRNIYH